MAGVSSARDAVSAYDGAGHVTDKAQPHRLDFVEPSAWPRPRPPAVKPLRGSPAASAPRVIRHEIDSPARLGFGFGFGFAAGVWTFRASVAVIAVIAILLGLWRLLSVALH